MSKLAIRGIFATLTVWAGLALAQAQTPKLTVIHSFTGNADGANPGAGVILDENGNIYGTTSTGKNSYGTVFKIDTKRKLSVLHTFTGLADGGQSGADLVRDPQGNLYGTGDIGGAYGDGTAFKINRSGHFSVLHSFGAGRDLSRPAGIVLDSSGILYGVAISGGGAIVGEGGVFRLSKTGHETVLYRFGPPPDGAGPEGSMVRDEEGNLFGTTFGGGAASSGAVFKLDSAGNETVLISFPGGTEGSFPMAGLIQDSTGNLYGTTFGTPILFGQGYYGTIFKLDANGVETVLHSFTGGADGGHPIARLVMDASGNLYGTASDGGAFTKGVIFKLDTAGNYTVLRSFSGRDGEGPASDLVFDATGAIYGTTGLGGAFNKGVVFKLTNP